MVKLDFKPGFNFRIMPRKYQELAKGITWCDSLADIFMSRKQAGWAFNDDWWLWEDITEGSKVKYSPSEARKISKNSLITKPFFNYFLDREIHNNAKNNLIAKTLENKVVYDSLARGIPALTYASGVMSLNDNIAYNYDLEFLGRNTKYWPISGHEKPSQKQRWLHSDIKDVAFPIIYPTFQTLVTQGQLK
jgi:hypothetical protein